MKKFLFLLVAVMVLGSASAKSVDGSVNQGAGTSQADGSRSMWAG
ncbi:hypothetical protein [Deinococcus planocerae]|nr:hypothetical protein [Deinococcus planocerae]